MEYSEEKKKHSFPPFDKVFIKCFPHAKHCFNHFKLNVSTSPRAHRALNVQANSGPQSAANLLRGPGRTLHTWGPRASRG